MEMNVKVGYKEYKVVEQVLQTATDVNYGMHDGSKSTIYINPEWCKKDCRHANTLIHELLHAIYDVYHIQDTDDEERTVTTMANGLTQVLKDNPELFTVLRKFLLKD